MRTALDRPCHLRVDQTLEEVITGLLWSSGILVLRVSFWWLSLVPFSVATGHAEISLVGAEISLVGFATIMTSWFPRTLSTMALSLPFAVWTVDCVFSLCTVRGTSMMPSLCDGDVVLVRKADILPIIVKDSSEEVIASRARVLRLEGGHQQPILFARPPMVLPGDVIVFCSPQTAFPNEYHIKRVIGVGGQMIRPGNRFRGLELIQRYNLWAEGDNANNSEDSGTYGAVSKKLLVGQAEFVVWPPSRWGRVGKIVPPEGRSWWT